MGEREPIQNGAHPLKRLCSLTDVAGSTSRTLSEVTGELEGKRKEVKLTQTIVGVVKDNFLNCRTSKECIAACEPLRGLQATSGEELAVWAAEGGSNGADVLQSALHQEEEVKKVLQAAEVATEEAKIKAAVDEAKAVWVDEVTAKNRGRKVIGQWRRAITYNTGAYLRRVAAATSLAAAVNEVPERDTVELSTRYLIEPESSSDCTGGEEMDGVATPSTAESVCGSSSISISSVSERGSAVSPVGEPSKEGGEAEIADLPFRPCKLLYENVYKVCEFNYCYFV